MQETNTQFLKINGEIIRYIFVGLATNGGGYLLYLILTMLLNVGHKTAMSALYAVGTMISFYANRQWTFRITGSVKIGLVRFALVITLGYFLNLLGLYLFVDVAGWQHELVQAAAILVISICFFFANKYYVHAPRKQ